MNFLRAIFGQRTDQAVHSRLVRYTADPRFTRVAPTPVLARR